MEVVSSKKTIQTVLQSTQHVQDQDYGRFVMDTTCRIYKQSDIFLYPGGNRLND